MRYIRLLTVAGGLLLGVVVAVADEPVQHFTGVHVAQDYFYVYGSEFTIGGIAAQPGDEVGVFTPNGVLCGATRVISVGSYRSIGVCRDDPATPVKDGASGGDVLSFRVWDASAGLEFASSQITLTYVSKPNNDGQPYWAAGNDVCRVDLAAAPAGEPIAFTLSLRHGWNLCSLPFSVDSVDGAAGVLVDAQGVSLVETLWGWDVDDARFTPLTESITRQEGFWAYCPREQGGTTHAIHDVIEDRRISLRPGWNLAGPAEDVPVAQLQGMDAVTSIWGWDGENCVYVQIPTTGGLEVGRAYWFSVSGDDTVQLAPAEQ